jgi:hypothetical protein
VAEDLHDHALVDSLGEQESCRSVPGVMQAELVADTCAAAHAPYPDRGGLSIRRTSDGERRLGMCTLAVE